MGKGDSVENRWKPGLFLEWKAYKQGFGDLDNEFFIGFEKLYMILASEQHELLVLLKDYIEVNRYQLFDNFTIGSEATNYSLQSVGSSYGDEGDSLEYHLGMQFSTKDRKNDLGGGANCAQYFMGAWWYRHCHTSHLLGIYGENKNGRGILWATFGYDYANVSYMLKRAAMLIRPKRLSLNRTLALAIHSNKEDYDGNKAYELYDDFSVGPESNNYTLESVGSFSGNAGDSLTYHLGMQFSTKDRKNDAWTGNCAIDFTGAWWFRACHSSNLCGTYGQYNYSKGVVWHAFTHLFTDMKRAVMMIGPKTN